MRLIAQVAAQEAGEERIPGAEHVVDLDLHPARDQPVLEPLRRPAGEHDAALCAALADDDGVRGRTDAAHGLEGVLDPRGDVQLLLGPHDQIAVGQHAGQRLGHARRARVAAGTGGVAAQAPQIGPVVDVEEHLAAVRLLQLDRLALRPRPLRQREVRAGDEDGGRGGDEILVDVVLAQGAVGAVVAVEDERECLLVAYAEQHERGEALTVHHEPAGVDALARQLLAHEAAHGLLAHAADEGRLQPEARSTDRDVGGTATDGPGKRRDVLQATADLLPVKVDADTPDGDEIKLSVHAAACAAAWMPAQPPLSRMILAGAGRGGKSSGFRRVFELLAAHCRLRHGAALDDDEDRHALVVAPVSGRIVHAAARPGTRARGARGRPGGRRDQCETARGLLYKVGRMIDAGETGRS